MNKPRLPSQLHPNYPKSVQWSDVQTRMLTIKPAPAEDFIKFYQTHPEFEGEGEYVFRCPFCGDENSYDEIGGYCCGEVGHCEWVLENDEGEPI